MPNATPSGGKPAARLLEQARWLRQRALSLLPGHDHRPPCPAGLPDWRSARPGIAVPPDTAFHDIQVLPARRYTYLNFVFDGGPVAGAEADVLHHLVHDRAVPGPAKGVARPLPLATPAIWGGRCFFHFGHLAVEHMNRLPGALYRHPGLPALFTLQPGKVVSEVPPYFWAMAAWLGLGPDRIRFVTAPLRVPSLHVSPQAEYLEGPAPPAWHLDLLDELPRLNGLRPVPRRVLYVHRLGQLAQGNGAHAGEETLVRALQAAGAAVMDPGSTPFADQMASYAGARHLVFAEGSAVHGRQMLGRIDQEITILRRRPHSMMAHRQLAIRCSALHHAPILRHYLPPIGRNGERMHALGISVFRPEAVIDTFRRLSVDLRPHWSDADHERLVARDLHRWAAAVMKRRDIDRARTREAIAALFTQLGIRG